MSVLPYQEILAMCSFQAGDDTKETVTGPIISGLKKNIRSAGYDLRLGDEYYLQTDVRGGKIEVQQLDAARAATLVIPPNGVIILTTVESLKLPDNLVGHLTLKMDLLLRGLIMANQSQVDAGYEGGIFFLLYNLSNQNVALQLGDSVLRLELARLASATKKPYEGAYTKNVSLAQVLRFPIGSSLADLAGSLAAMRKEADRSQKQLRGTQYVGGVLGALVIILTSMLTYFGPLHTDMLALRVGMEDVKQLHAKEADLYGVAKKGEIDSLTKEVNELRQQMEDMKKANAKGR